jgi:hypothetical protein
MLDSNEYYFRSRNCALPQDSHSLRGSTRDLWTVCMPAKYTTQQMKKVVTELLSLVVLVQTLMQISNLHEKIVRH